VIRPHHDKQDKRDTVGKSSKTSERRARIEQLERERKAAERRRLFLFSGVIGLVALVIIGLTGWSLWSQQKEQAAIDSQALADFGVTRAAAGCTPVQTSPATGGADHIAAPQPIHYNQAPPASGPHRPTWAPFERKFYTPQDRPEVEMLVHNLEHGYNILWYDQTVAKDPKKVKQIEDLASKFEGSERDPANAFIAAPWMPSDGPSMPAGKHIAMTHWYADPGTGANEKGISQYCSQMSGAVVADFMKNYTQAEAREGGPQFL
jgi:Protein of unknown function (DUF3105)